MEFSVARSRCCHLVTKRRLLRCTSTSSRQSCHDQSGEWIFCRSSSVERSGSMMWGVYFERGCDSKTIEDKMRSLASANAFYTNTIGAFLNFNHATRQTVNHFPLSRALQQHTPNRIRWKVNTLDMSFDSILSVAKGQGADTWWLPDDGHWGVHLGRSPLLKII
jgi:hypothetical protein